MEMDDKHSCFLLPAISPMRFEIINDVDLACFIWVHSLAHHHNPVALKNIPDLVGIMPVGRIQVSRSNWGFDNREDFTLSNQLIAAQLGIKDRCETAPGIQ